MPGERELLSTKNVEGEKLEVVPSSFRKTEGRYRSRRICHRVDMEEEFSIRSSVATAEYGEESLAGELQHGIIVWLVVASRGSLK